MFLAEVCFVSGLALSELARSPRWRMADAPPAKMMGTRIACALAVHDVKEGEGRTVGWKGNGGVGRRTSAVFVLLASPGSAMRAATKLVME